MKTGSSLPHSQHLATPPYFDPYDSTTRPPYRSVSLRPVQYYPPIYAFVFQAVCSLAFLLSESMQAIPSVNCCIANWLCGLYLHHVTSLHSVYTVLRPAAPGTCRNALQLCINKCPTRCKSIVFFLCFADRASRYNLSN